MRREGGENFCNSKFQNSKFNFQKLEIFDIEFYILQVNLFLYSYYLTHDGVGCTGMSMIVKMKKEDEKDEKREGGKRSRRRILYGQS